MARKSDFITLHKYFLNANRMRHLFEKEVCNKEEIVQFSDLIEANIYLYLWYGCLYVVIEGWQNLKLKDPTLDELFNQDDKILLLKNVRNDTFHFQKNYFPARTIKMLKDKNFVPWVRQVNSALGRILLIKIKE